MFKPVDKVVEGEMVLVMEEIASRLNLDELSIHLVFSNVTKNDVLRILF